MEAKCSRMVVQSSPLIYQCRFLSRNKMWISLNNYFLPNSLIKILNIHSQVNNFKTHDDKAKDKQRIHCVLLFS